MSEKTEGYWIPKKMIKKRLAMVCSVCGNRVFGRSAVQIVNRHEFCPWCESRMRKEVKA